MSESQDDLTGGVPNHDERLSPAVTWTDWWDGARPHTWANAIAPVLTGTAAAAITGEAHLVKAIMAAIVALALIIGVNYANDYSDGIRGTDDERTGPQRITASGLVAPGVVKRAAFLCFGIAAVVGVVLSLMSSPWLILVGAVAILGAWFYTGGENPYGYRGLGEVAVFIFFGLVAVLGTEFTQSGHITIRGLVMAIAIGLFSAAVNLANNLRDIPTDEASGKITLAVRLGDQRTRQVWFIMVAIGVVLTVALMYEHFASALALVAVPFFFIAAKPVTSGAEGPELIPVLKHMGRGMLVWSVMMLIASVVTGEIFL